MKEKLQFIGFSLCLAWAIYKYVRTKDLRMIYGMVVFSSVFSSRYPFYVPIEFVLSFNGLFCFSVLLYKRFSCFSSAPLNNVSGEPALFAQIDSQTKNWNQERLGLAILSLFFAVVFFVQGLMFPRLTLPVGYLYLTAFEFGLAFCAFWGCGRLLYRIFRYKFDRSLMILSLIFLMFGMISMVQGVFSVTS